MAHQHRPLPGTVREVLASEPPSSPSGARSRPRGCGSSHTVWHLLAQAPVELVVLVAPEGLVKAADRGQCVAVEHTQVDRVGRSRAPAPGGRPQDRRRRPIPWRPRSRRSPPALPTGRAAHRRRWLRRCGPAWTRLVPGSRAGPVIGRPPGPRWGPWTSPPAMLRPEAEVPAGFSMTCSGRPMQLSASTCSVPSPLGASATVTSIGP